MLQTGPPEGSRLPWIELLTTLSIDWAVKEQINQPVIGFIGP